MELIIHYLGQLHSDIGLDVNVTAIHDSAHNLYS